MTRPRLLDLFCGAGGAAMGYHRAGFDVVGVDLHPQPHYPFEFHQADALTFPLAGFDAIHASPPCQAYSVTRNLASGSSHHPDLLPMTRVLLVASGLPYIIENVKGAPLWAAMLLCGSMFGIGIAKHRYFETNWPMPALAPAGCNHVGLYDPYHGAGRRADTYRAAQGTPWMPGAGGASRKRGVTGDVSNAIPPAFTEWIGVQLLRALGVAA